MKSGDSKWENWASKCIAKKGAYKSMKEAKESLINKVNNLDSSQDIFRRARQIANNSRDMASKQHVRNDWNR